MKVSTGYIRCGIC